MQTVLLAGKMWSLSEFFIKPLYKIQNSSIFASELQMIVPTSWQLSLWKSMSRTSKSPLRATPSAIDVNTPAKTVEVGWENVVQRHIKGVYLTLCSWRVESSKFSNQSLEHSNGRCPRVWFYPHFPRKQSLWNPVAIPTIVGGLYPHSTQLLHGGIMYHIGVGSDVVCSTLKAMLEPRLVERTTDVSTLEPVCIL